jgi:hypothetical protein
LSTTQALGRKLAMLLGEAAREGEREGGRERGRGLVSQAAVVLALLTLAFKNSGEMPSLVGREGGREGGEGAVVGGGGGNEEGWEGGKEEGWRNEAGGDEKVRV